MKVISVDLPWNPDKKGRRALAIADLNGNIKVAHASDDKEMLELVHDSAQSGSIILLDIPIDGCNNLGVEHFRAIDRAIARQALPALPASRAGSRGKALRDLLEKGKKRLQVYEIYPYAIYKFLAYLRDKNLLPSLKANKSEFLLDDGFRAYWPPKYKREKKREKRLENMEYLYSLLTDTDVGLNFRIPLHYPDASSNLGQLSDEYDACLGAIAGIYFANKSSYSCVAGDSQSGSILLLADRWLANQLSQEVTLVQAK